MNDLIRQQRIHMDRECTPPPYQPRNTLTPMADYACFSSLIESRQLLPNDLSARSILLVNCGWGEDAHFFQTEGATSLTGSDISSRALGLLRERCTGAKTLLADTVRLPFADGAFDLVGVRSGLHHLEEPFDGLREMLRVAREGVFLIEAQDTLLVPLLVRLGFLEDKEEAGNTVYRFNRHEVAERLAAFGISDFTIKTAWLMQLPIVLAIGKRLPGRLPVWALRAFIRVFNLFFGRLGNCMIVVARKRPWT